MSGEQSEEKQLPASSMKLKKEREKGKIAKSADLYSAVAVLISIVLLYVLSPYNHAYITNIFDASSQAVTFKWEYGFNYAKNVLFYYSLMIMLPIIIAVTFAVIMSNLIYNKGIPISFDPIIPKFDHLNPASGFKRIFGRRGRVEGGIKLVRLFIWLSLAFGIVWFALPTLVNSPLCGVPCSLDTTSSLIFQLIAAACIVIFLIALFDMPIQQALFLYDMKMTHSEKKREDKDHFGSPEVRSERRRFYQEGSATTVPLKVQNSSLVIVGDNVAVAIHYSRDSGMGPIVTGKAKDEEMKTFLSAAQGIAKYSDPNLAKGLSYIPRGSTIPQKFYDDIARAIINTGVSV